MITLNKLDFSNGGKTVLYDYEVAPAFAKFFNLKNRLSITYNEDVSNVPQSILTVPFLANVMPMAWFIGFDVLIDEVDSTFENSLKVLRAEFGKHFKNITDKGKLRAKKSVENTFDQDNSALLFSGGLDSFESLTRNLDKNPYLISVLGADIEIADTKRWNEFKKFNDEEKVIDNDRLCYVTANLRTFYTYEVDLLVDISWWGKIQHGMALLTLIAPLSHLKGIRNMYIASSNTIEVNFGWGSTSETDEKVKWANAKVVHDGFHLRRTEKIQNIVDFGKKTGNKINLRVCYSEFREGANCSVCTKCQRTMFGLILSGENPNEYGFSVPENFYTLLHKNFKNSPTMSIGVAYEWKCLQEKAIESSDFYVINDEISEKNNINTFAALKLSEIINKNSDKNLATKKMKYTIISKFPKLFKFYLNLRRKI